MISFQGLPFNGTVEHVRYRSGENGGTGRSGFDDWARGAKIALDVADSARGATTREHGARPFGRLVVSRAGICRPETFGPTHALKGVGFQRRNEMLGLGLLGTIIVIVLIVWFIRRV
jgi:hypothetical protein